MIVIGSHALIHWDAMHGRPLRRSPKDIDMIGSLTAIYDWAKANEPYIEFMLPTSPWKFKGKLKDGRTFEIEIAEVNPSSQMLWNMRHSFQTRQVPIDIEDDTGIPVETTACVPPIEYLYLIKRSHVYWPVHWQKTMQDLTYLKAFCGEFKDEHQVFYNARLAENEAKFGPRFQAKLNQTNEKFFAKSERSLNRQFNHDDLHEIVKYNDKPMYMVLKTDQSKALIDKHLFDALPHESKLDTVREETMVIALERYVITGKETDPVLAYQRALQRICTNLTSGWFREFAIDNWKDLEHPDADYVGKFNATV